VVIQGKGFGHGVGLCQEGAMRMARLGYSYGQIALFYFPGVRIVSASREKFFQQKASNF
jgi:stage II sporulation protein D